jgi:hypothetical protein
MGIKFGHLVLERANSGEFIALFGNAELVKRIDSKYELCGGSTKDQIAAQKWVSIFIHE